MDCHGLSGLKQHLFTISQKSGDRRAKAGASAQSHRAQISESRGLHSLLQPRGWICSRLLQVVGWTDSSRLEDWGPRFLAGYLAHTPSHALHVAALASTGQDPVVLVNSSNAPPPGGAGSGVRMRTCPPHTPRHAPCLKV